VIRDLGELQNTLSRKNKELEESKQVIDHLILENNYSTTQIRLKNDLITSLEIENEGIKHIAEEHNVPIDTSTFRTNSTESK